MILFETLEVLMVALVTLLLAITLLNLATVRRVEASATQLDATVEILIPMRDEAVNATAVVSSALAQRQLSSLKVRALDDGSKDATLSILQGIDSQNFEVVVGNEPPAGWLGKNFALATLANRATADYLVFIDADVRLEPDAVAAAIKLLNDRKLDYLSPYPRQIAKSLLERLVQPLLQWSWLATLPLLAAERSLRASTVVANGQFFIVRSAAYKAIGGHAAIKGEVLDDMELARSLRRGGFRGTVVDGSQLAACRMYESNRNLLAGYLKSQWRAFGGVAGAIISIFLLTLTSIAPVLFAASGYRSGAISYFAIVISRLLVAIRTRSSLTSAFLHPIAIAIWIALIATSVVLKRSGKLSWRGRAL